MKLTQLDLTSFRSYRGLSLDLKAAHVLIAGLNGTGKSSIRDAISWGLLGHCQGTDAKGAGADVLIPTGQKEAVVSVDIAGVGLAQRSYNGAGGSFLVWPSRGTTDAGFTGTSQIQQAALLIKLDTTPAFLDAVLDTSIFLDLGHAEAKALVLSLLGVTIYVNEKSYSLDELDSHYKQAFEDRKLAKKNLQQCVLPAKSEASGMPTAEHIETKLTALRGELGAAQQAAGTTIGRRQTLTSQIKKWNVVEEEEPEEDLTQQITAAEAEVAKLETAVVPTVAPAKGDPARAAFLRSRAEALSHHDPTAGCVLDAKVQCPAPRKQFQMALAGVERELEGLLVPSPERPEKSQVMPIRVTLANLQRRQQEREDRINQTIADTSRLETLRQELDGLPDIAKAEADIATLQARIGNGEELLRKARTHWGALRGYEWVVEQQKTLKAEVDRLEALCEVLGPKGARAKALGEAMGKFEAAVNPYVQPFGWTIKFSVEPWEVFANDRPVETYSRSERYRIGIALQLGIAQLSGLNFAIIDEIDMLDVENRKVVSQMLLQAPLEQIIVLGTREPSQPLPKIPGALAYRLATKDGQTVIAERSA